MKQFSATIELHCAATQVFTFLNDQCNFRDLNRHNFQNYRVVSSDSVGVGASSQFELKTGVFHEAAQLKVTISEPPTLIVQEGLLGNRPFRTTWKIQPRTEMETELELITEYSLEGPAALLNKRIQSAFVRIYTRLLTDLAHHLAGN